jgi:hypothetical protein
LPPVDCTAILALYAVLCSTFGCLLLIAPQSWHYMQCVRRSVASCWLHRNLGTICSVFDVRLPPVDCTAILALYAVLCSTFGCLLLIAPQSWHYMQCCVRRSVASCWLHRNLGTICSVMFDIRLPPVDCTAILALYAVLCWTFGCLLSIAPQSWHYRQCCVRRSVASCWLHRNLGTICSVVFDVRLPPDDCTAILALYTVLCSMSGCLLLTVQQSWHYMQCCFRRSVASWWLHRNLGTISSVVFDVRLPPDDCTAILALYAVLCSMSGCLLLTAPQSWHYMQCCVRRSVASWWLHRNLGTICSVVFDVWLPPVDCTAILALYAVLCSTFSFRLFN